MTERFTKMMVELYGRDIENAVDFCIDETYATYGEPITLDDLFIIWGQICEYSKRIDQEKEQKGV